MKWQLIPFRRQVSIIIMVLQNISIGDTNDFAKRHTTSDNCWLLTTCKKKNIMYFGVCSNRNFNEIFLIIWNYGSRTTFLSVLIFNDNNIKEQRELEALHKIVKYI